MKPDKVTLLMQGITALGCIVLFIRYAVSGNWVMTLLYGLCLLVMAVLFGVYLGLIQR